MVAVHSIEETIMSELSKRITAACAGSPIHDVAAALSGVLVLAVEQQFNSTVGQAVEHLQNFLQHLQEMAANPAAFNSGELR
jgi:transcriptional regulator of acetoin/glycerol metabolism